MLFIPLFLKWIIDLFGFNTLFIEQKIDNLSNFVNYSSDVLNKLAIVSKLRPEEIQNWITTIQREFEKECSNFFEDFRARLTEADTIYKEHNNPVKRTKEQRDDLEELISRTSTPETLKTMELRNTNYKTEIVKKNKLLKEFFKIAKEKKKPGKFFIYAYFQPIPELILFYRCFSR